MRPQVQACLPTPALAAVPTHCKRCERCAMPPHKPQKKLPGSAPRFPPRLESHRNPWPCLGCPSIAAHPWLRLVSPRLALRLEGAASCIGPLHSRDGSSPHLASPTRKHVLHLLRSRPPGCASPSLPQPRFAARRVGALGPPSRPSAPAQWLTAPSAPALLDREDASHPARTGRRVRPARQGHAGQAILRPDRPGRMLSVPVHHFDDAPS